MRQLLLILMFSALLCSGSAVAKKNAKDSDFPYIIKKIKKSTKKRAYVDNGWKGDVKCIRADIKAKEDLGDTEFYVKAYFYDKNKKLVEEYSGPAKVSDDWKNYRSIPDYLHPNKIYDVYFPITDKIEKGKYKWKSVVVVFGDSNRAVADVYKGDSVLNYDFPEKELVKKNATEKN